MLDRKTYVDEAEKVIISLKNNEDKFNKILTSNQIRNILSLYNELYDMVRTVSSDELSDDVLSHIQYVKMRVVYLAGRDADQNFGAPVKAFLKESKLLEHMKAIGNSRDSLLLVCKYMEALVAYHKFYGSGR